ncbi:hypothetical protein [Streptomyces yaizuensis]|uniref:Uncharacterized protein n=1 Tax=Streptomyces yaizuensis TaxID=2989713 RepID=A0ABQ5NVB8_9ACTN|nr:hypothetical protein [Streptomyces sp. YSPA8]GLF94318.1 hypothetical protein SYYSPA8_08495 [Streptomyces sp. YSPA8]
MSGPPSRKEEQVRRMLAGGPAPVPAGLAERAEERGERIRRHRRGLRRVLGALLLTAAVAFTLWANAARPWESAPAGVTPRVDSVDSVDGW